MVRLIKILSMVIVLMTSAGQTMAQGKIAVLSIQKSILNTEAAQTRLNELRATEDYVTSKQQFEDLKKEGRYLDRLKGTWKRT